MKKRTILGIVRGSCLPPAESGNQFLIGQISGTILNYERGRVSTPNGLLGNPIIDSNSYKDYKGIQGGSY